MTLHLAPDLSVAQWMIDELRRQDWWRLVTRGPLGFEAYARLRFIPDPAYPGMSEGDFDPPDEWPLDEDQLRRAVAVVAAHTTTREDLYVAIWDGWLSEESGSDVPKWSLPNREFFLLRGDSADFQAWRLPQWAEDFRSELPIAAYVWPADHAWCVTGDVDPHFATIAGTTDAIEALLADPGLDVVRDDPDTEPPFYF